jgi:hypothetical protein
MQHHVSLIVLRRLRIARLSAALLILLIVLPFTAPFSVLAVAEMLGEQTYHQGDGAASKAVDDLADPDCFSLSIGPASLDCGACPVSSSTHVDTIPYRILVLRI